jgi:hypothetical protein
MFMFLRLARAIPCPNASSKVVQNLVGQNRLLRQPNRCRGSGKRSVAQLRKWRRFQIVHDKQTADWILLLSADRYNGGYIIFASGQTGTIVADGQIEQDRVPKYNRQAPVHDAYLTVIDPRNGQNLWSDSHVWGGLLTGANSAGARLVQKLRKQIGK